MSTALPHAASSPVVVEYVSPSALETFALCPRKWGFRKIDRLEAPEGSGAALGSATHGQHEGYLRDGLDYDLNTREGEIASCTQHLIPEQGSGRPREEGGYVSVEVDMRVEHHGIKFGGRIDATWLEAAPKRVAIVLDHKTTRDFKYAKLTKEALLDHPQAPIYALWATKHYKTNYVELRWNYAKTQGRPRAMKSWHLVNRGEILQAMQEPVRVARRMLKVIDDVNERRARGESVGARDLEANPDACGAFGGCPYMGVCDPVNYQEKETMPKPAFLSSVRNKVEKEEQAEATGAGSAINPPESTIPVEEAQAEVETAPPAEKPARGRGRPKKSEAAPPAVVEVSVEDGASVAEKVAYEATDAEVGRAFRVLLREVVSAVRAA